MNNPDRSCEGIHCDGRQSVDGRLPKLCLRRSANLVKIVGKGVGVEDVISLVC